MPERKVIICFLITLSDSSWSTERMWSRVWITICGNHSIVFPVIGRGKHNWWPGDRRAWPEEGRGDATGMKPSTWQHGRQSLEAIQNYRMDVNLLHTLMQTSASTYTIPPPPNQTTNQTHTFPISEDNPLYEHL